MTPKTPIGESPYSLAFGTEAVLSPEVVFPTLKIQTHDEGVSSQQLRENLDLLEEKRADTHLRMLAYRKVFARLYNHRGKLALNWEGPYRVIDVVRKGTYILAIVEGWLLSRIMAHLKSSKNLCIM
ncbi:hypothetical protein BHM03_00018875 [Ensete ventricosum]|uniref:Uncharacterized protein n=1 Tax=Ensete ventricosum TaxID=4639 RepID=A0A445MFI9_ENSVE|nr:hypothetical protein BHM03_00018875 [Ensete ventricosum]